MAQKRQTNSHKYHIRFRSKTQEEALHTFSNNALTFLLGPAGTGKTYLSAAFAVKEIVENRKDAVIFTRPIVESQESLGSLPGDVQEKIEPHMRPLMVQYRKCSHSVKEKLLGRMSIIPIAYMRGETFEASTCVLDEAQNCTYGQLKLYLTRLAPDSKYIVAGDITQTDIKDSGLKDVVDKLRNCPNVGIVEFSAADIVRHQLVRDIDERL